MIVECEKCQARFRLDEERYTGNLVKIRCTKCSAITEVAIEKNEREAPSPRRALTIARVRGRRAQPAPALPADFQEFLESTIKEELVDIEKVVTIREVPEPVPEKPPITEVSKVLGLPTRPPLESVSRVLPGELFASVGVVVLAILAGLLTYAYLKGPSRTLAPPSGTMELTNVRGYYVENRESGSLFAIEGRAVNRYAEPRSMVRIGASLITADGRVASRKEVYAGAQLERGELASFPLSRLEGLMSKPPSVRVGRGESLPFFVIFSDVPRNLSEFSVRALSSQNREK